ncbi:MAG: hypothetical protein ABW321_16200 [Polyangiales bacterium]
MAQDHKLQDNPSAPPAKAAKQDRDATNESSAPASPLSAAKGPGAFAIGALGANAWAAGVGWTLLSPDVSLTQTVLASVGLVPLWTGAFVQARVQNERWQRGARWLLLGVFPLSLSAALCLGSEAHRERAHSAVSLALAAVSLLAYGAATLQACRVPLPLLPTTSHARRSEPRLRPKRPNLARSLMAMCLVVGAFAIALIAPFWSDYAEVEAAWGPTADAGATLTAVIAGAIGVTLIGLELGPLLKAKPVPPISARKRRNRIIMMLFVAAFGGSVYLLLMH